MSNKDWENVQQRVFTKWTNTHLKKRGREIKDLITDLKDGVMLIHLYESISDEHLDKWYKEPKSKFHAIANLNLVLGRINSFVGSVGIKVQFSAEQLYDGDKRQILGMIWVLIHKFEIQDISEEQHSAKEGLLLWCKKKTAGYKDVNVKNFSESWEDGLAFCALIHKHRPDLIDFDSLNKDDRLKNLQLAFDVAEKHLDIPQLLDANDMVNYKPDEKAVMTYVAYYWKKFASSQKNEKAARRIGNAAKKQKELEQLEHDYAKRAKDLVDWIEPKKNEFDDTDKLIQECSDLPTTIDKSNQFKNFKTKEKPTKQAEKNDLEVLLTNIRSKQKNEGLPLFNPPDDISSQNINDLWEKMSVNQEKYDKTIRDLVNLMRRLDVLLARFRSRAKKIRDWQEVKGPALANEDVDKYGEIQSLQARINTLDTFGEEIQSLNKLREQTNVLGQDLLDKKHQASDEVKDTMQKMSDGQDQVLNNVNDLKNRLQDRLKKLEDLQKRALEFAKKAEAINSALGDVELALIEPVQANSVKEVEEFESNVNDLEKDMNQNQKPALDQLAKLEKDLKNDGGDPTQYTSQTVPALQDTFKKFKVELDQKKKDLADEKKKQQLADKLLAEYAKNVKEFNDWTNIQKDIVAADLKGQPEEQLEALKKFGDQASKEAEKRFQNIVKLNQQLEENNIAEKSETSIQMVTQLEDQLKSMIKKRLEVVEQAIISKKPHNLTKEQIAEIRDTYNHFDRDRDGSLTKFEFKACLASIGEDLPDEVLDKTFVSYDKDHDGRITFDEFFDFVIKINKESTGKSDVLASFQALANGRETITEAELRSAMDKEQVEFLLQKMPKASNGEYDYQSYVASTFQ